MRSKFAALLVIGICLVALAGTANAQTKMMFGVKGQFGMTNLTGDIEDTKMKLGFGGGAVARFALSPVFEIQPEVMVALKGCGFDIPEEYEDDYKIKLTYIDIPVLARYNIPTEGNIKPAIFAGPYLGILMSGKQGDKDVKDELKSTDFGLVFGAGIDLKVGAKGTVAIDARYNLGLSNTNDEDGEEEDEESKIKYSGFGLNIAYLFSMGQ